MRPSLVGAFLASAVGVVAQDEQPILQLNEDESFHFEILVPLGQALYQGADVGPVLGVAKDITPGDFESFSEAFYTLANTTKARAEDPEIAYNPVNVRDTWFSVASYFRRADFYLHGDWENPLIDSLWKEQLTAFDHAISALPVPGERIQIPADNFTVEAIWFTADQNQHTRGPTLVLCNGYDAAQEDLYHTLVVPALARGWNCLTYEGPGHPTVRRRQNLGFIHDWERVVAPTIDWLLKEKGDAVDPNRVALYGNSMAGYLAARAAAFEPRVSALLLNGGIYDLRESYVSMLGDELMALFEEGSQTVFDDAVSAALSAPDAPTSLRWGVEQGLWSFNTRSAFEFLQMTEAYNLEGVIDKIKVPVWLADAEFETFFSGQSKMVSDALGDLATYHEFLGPAGYHTQIGAFVELTSVVFAWLHRTLG